MSQSPSFSGTQITRYEALAAVDAAGFEVAPASLLVERLEGRGIRLLAAGTPEQTRGHPAWGHARVVSLPRSVLIPGLVNAHTHLDLTHIGPRPFEASGGLVGWVGMIGQQRHVASDAIAASVRRGIELSLAGGTVAVGDIAGAPLGRPSLAPFRALAESRLAGVSFLEFFGIGNRLAASMEGLGGVLDSFPSEGDRVRLGLQPHAPNTIDLALYRYAAEEAVRRGLPLCTHLAETPEEREFVARGTGPQRVMLERLGIWDESILEHVGKGLHPVEHLAGVLGAAPFLVAHVNDCDDAAIRTLARTGTSVAYCPRASAYFGAERHFGPHRYREMLSAGINVALGTDSIVNLPAGAAGSAGMSILDEMRFLHRRDGTDARLLLAMGTVNGARALGLEAGAFTFGAGGELAGLVSVEVEGSADSYGRAILESDAPARLLD